jgi:hypothetical protein
MRQTELECLTAKTLPDEFFGQRRSDMSGKVLIYGRGGGIGSFVANSLAQNGDGLHFTGRDEQS